MKIDLTAKVQQLAIRTVHGPNKHQGTNGFDSVLQDSIQKTNPPVVSAGHAIQPLMGPVASAGFEPNSKDAQCAMVQGLLDNLESYQHMLADPVATLKMIHPILSQMERQAASTQVLLNHMPEGHPLKMILVETVQNISQEVEKFKAGYYVDA
jgi:hypothetical protein